VDYVPAAPYEYNSGGFGKYVQYPPQAFNIDNFSHPEIQYLNENRVEF